MNKCSIIYDIQQEIEEIQNSISKLEKDSVLESINFILETHTNNLITIHSEPLDVLNVSYLNQLEIDILKIKRLIKESY